MRNSRANNRRPARLVCHPHATKSSCSAASKSLTKTRSVPRALAPWSPALPLGLWLSRRHAPRPALPLGRPGLDRLRHCEPGNSKETARESTLSGARGACPVPAKLTSLRSAPSNVLRKRCGGGAWKRGRPILLPRPREAGTGSGRAARPLAGSLALLTRVLRAMSPPLPIYRGRSPHGGFAASPPPRARPAPHHPGRPPWFARIQEHRRATPARRGNCKETAQDMRRVPPPTTVSRCSTPQD